MNGVHNDKRIKPEKGFVATLSKIQETAPSIMSTNAGTVLNGSNAEIKDDGNQDR